MGSQCVNVIVELKANLTHLFMGISSLHWSVLLTFHVFFLFIVIFFLGGGRVAKVVATAAAKHLTPVTLELGGIYEY
jgi:hypothetical protein